MLHIDNELHDNTIAYRYRVISEAMDFPHHLYSDNIDMVSLRGRLRDLYGLARMFEQIEPGQYKIIILDAFYRTLPRDTDENDNGAIANLYNLIDHYASRLQCAFVLIHHTSKGNQSGKAVTDVGAGAGSQSRAADAHLVLRRTRRTEHHRAGIGRPKLATFGHFTVNPSLNDAGQVAFFASFIGTSGGQSDNEGIYRGDGFTLIQIAREGQPVPDGNGVFNGVELGAPAINNLGQVAFYTSISGTTGGYPNDDAAIFLYDELLGLRQVVRRGDALLGSTITGLSFSSGSAPEGNERSGLNDLGQIAYGFTLADGRTGVASSGFAAITEPTALVT